MFSVGITDHYVAYDHDWQRIITTSLYPETEIKLYGKKTKKTHVWECWYPELSLQLADRYVQYTERRNYLQFELVDYGVKDIRGVFFRLMHKGTPIDSKEFYQTILYDSHDQFALYIPVDGSTPVGDYTLNITGLKYLNDEVPIECESSPQNSSDEHRKVMQAIRGVREQNLAVIGEGQITDERKYQRKIPFADDLLETAWQLYPELVELLSFVEPMCCLLEEKIAALPKSFSEIECSPPKENENMIYVPIECTFNQKFFARLFLIRDHTVDGRIISPVDLIQLQISIKAENENLLLYLYGSHFIDPLLVSPNETIGDDKCKGIQSNAKKYSAILCLIDEIRNNLLRRYNEKLVRGSNITIRFFRCVDLLKSWIKERYDEVALYSQEARPSFWTSEYRLYQYVKLLCPDAIYQYRTEWLDAQSLDIFVPQYHCAIEYQGRQHYDAVDYFGGEAKLLEQRQMDEGKRQKCKANGITLCEWSYKDKLSFSNVLSFLNENVFPNPIEIHYIEQCLESNLPFSVSDLFLPASCSKKGEANSKKPLVLHTEIRKYTLNGEYVCRYASIKEAANDVAISPQQINKVLSNRAATAGGFVWRRTEVDAPISSIPPKEPYIAENCAKSIYQVDTTGEVLAEFDSINEAERQTGINRKSIRDVLKGRQKTAGGYCWIRK